jgi:hypothetical protein
MIEIGGKSETTIKALAMSNMALNIIMSGSL